MEENKKRKDDPKKTYSHKKPPIKPYLNKIHGLLDGKREVDMYYVLENVGNIYILSLFAPNSLKISITSFSDIEEVKDFLKELKEILNKNMGKGKKNFRFLNLSLDMGDAVSMIKTIEGFLKVNEYEI